MPWRLGILAAVLAWLLIASPAGAAIQRHTDSQGVIHISNVAAARPVPAPAAGLADSPASAPPKRASLPEPQAALMATLEESAIEIRNGTRTQNLAHLTRALLQQEGFNVAVIGNHIDFGAQATMIYYLAGEEQMARALQAKIFPWAQAEEISRLKNGVAIKVLLGSDLLDQPRLMARLTGEEPQAAAPQAESLAAKPLIRAQAEARALVAAAELKQERLASKAGPAETSPEVQDGAPAEAPAVAAPSPSPTPESAAAAVIPALAPPEKSLAPPDAGAGSSQEADSSPGPFGMMAAAASVAAKVPAPAAAAGPAESTTQAATLSSVGGIQRYRDAQGVWHISNVAAENGDAAPAGLEAKSPEMKMATPETLPRRSAAVKASLPVEKVAWTRDHADLATLMASKTRVSRDTAPEAPNLIRRYCDSKDVIHISNVEPEAPEPLPAPKRWSPAPVVAAAPLALKPVAWSGAAKEQPLKLVKARPALQSEITTEGGIKRWRDKKGVWHIETVEYPLPEGVVLPPRQAGPQPAPLLASVPARGNLPGTPAGVSPGSSLPQAAPRVPTVTAFRDRQGRLKITNDAPVMMSKPPAGAAPAPAELEPLIVEAAQVHRLPPTLIRAVIKTESNFCSWAVSPKGAMGLMQLMPGTAAFLGVQEPFNPRENVQGGCRYLRLLIDFFGGNVPLALAAYNAGYQRVIDCGYQVPPIKETQEFVTQVMERYVAEEHRTGPPRT